jgi:hypothetical protein
VEGVPLMVGATFERDTARIENEGSDVVVYPSLTRMEMFCHNPTALGVPVSRPVVLLKLAQAGLL